MHLLIDYYTKHYFGSKNKIIQVATILIHFPLLFLSFISEWAKCQSSKVLLLLLLSNRHVHLHHVSLNQQVFNVDAILGHFCQHLNLLTFKFKYISSLVGNQIVKVSNKKWPQSFTASYNLATWLVILLAWFKHN